MNAKQLRDSILQYAMQGRLVEQIPTDEPACQLTKHIKEEKAELIKRKIIKKEKPLPPIAENEIPFDIPSTWEWIRLGEISTKIHYGYTASAQTSGEAKLLRITDIQDNKVDWSEVPYCSIEEKKLEGMALKTRDILIARTGGTIGKSFLVKEINEISVFASYLIRVQLFAQIDEDYIASYLKSELYWSQLRSMSAGTGQPNVNAQNLKLLLVPIPPINEQKRIVNQINLIEEKINSYHTFYELNASIRNSFPTDLEKSVLQYAMQGKLDRQDVNDEQAYQLIDRVKEEKLRLMEQKIIKKEKPLPPITENEIPFDIPSTWEWIRLGEISIYIQRGKSPKYSLIENTPVISQKCIQWSGFTIEPAKFIDPDTLDKYDKIRFLQSGDILWNSTGLGTIGRVALYNSASNPYEQAVADSHVTVIRTSELIDSEYIYYYLASPEIQNAIEDIASGSTKQKELNTSTIKSILVPIPPFEEQKRIVNKIKELLSITKRF